MRAVLVMLVNKVSPTAYLNLIGRVFVVFKAVGVKGGVLYAHRRSVFASMRLGMRMGLSSITWNWRGRVVRPRRCVLWRPRCVAV